MKYFLKVEVCFEEKEKTTNLRSGTEWAVGVKKGTEIGMGKKRMVCSGKQIIEPLSKCNRISVSKET